MKDNEKFYKVYHRNYKSIEELYDDLSDAVLNIGLENNKISIHYNSDTLEIEPCRWGYYTYLNKMPHQQLMLILQIGIIQ